MTPKLFEIRDSATFIPVLAVSLESISEAARYLLSRSGYGRSADEQSKYILLCQINGGTGMCAADPHRWGGRTYPIAHQFIIDNFDDLASGEVIDVEFILGEKAEKSRPEREKMSD